MKNPIIHGNIKMGDRVALFNLPAVVTCTPTDWCLRGRNGKPACYALRNRFVFPNVLRGAQARLEFSRTDGFVEAVVSAIKKLGLPYFRFHSSGDFYSPEYVRKVIEIARACPEVLFRTTTRRRDFRSLLRKLNDLPNFIVRESLDDERPIPKMGLPFAALGHLPIALTLGTIRCQNDCNRCGYACWKKRVNMCFDEH